MRTKMKLGLLGLTLMLAMGSQANAGSTYHVTYDFDTSWSGDYAPGWDNTSYRHGEAPVGKMMEQVAGGRYGTNGMKLTADSVPADWMWWAGVNPIEVNSNFMTKQYDPWVSVDYYDEGWDLTIGAKQKTGQLYAVPSWVNPYINGSEDWTDVQFGARFNQPPTDDNYYYVAVGENHPGWVDTGESRENSGWVNLKMQLSSTDGMIHFFINGTDIGTSYRNDYDDLLGIGLYVMFEPDFADWSSKPSVIYDNFEFGSNAVPLPAAVWAGMMMMGSLGGVRVLRKKLQK